MQIVSDLHLEFYKNPLDIKLKVNAPVLALLGDICVCGTTDIGNLETFFDFYNTKYELIIWVPGNHEFYSGKKQYISMDQIIERCKLLCKKYKNILFLNNKSLDYDISGVKCRIVGTTLWTDMPKEKEKYALENLNDYNHIYTEGQRHIGLISVTGVIRLLPSYINALHIKASRYITRQIKDSPNPLIILTHHKPFLGGEGDSKSLKFYEPTGYESDQISKLSSVDKAKIKFWIYGHTHRHFNSVVNGIQMISNPKGYPGQQTKFENDLIIKTI